MKQALRNTAYSKLSAILPDTYYGQAPKSEPEKYIVFSNPTGLKDYDSVNTYPEDLIAISIYGKVLTEVESLQDSIESSFDRQQTNWAVTGFNVVDISEVSNSQRVIEDYFFNQIVYRFDLEPS